MDEETLSLPVNKILYCVTRNYSKFKALTQSSEPGSR